MSSKLDKLYRSILFSKFFVKGWGDPDGLIKLLKFRKLVSNRHCCLELVDPDHPVVITRDEETDGVRLVEGYFESPFNYCLPSLLPKESKNAYFQMVLPVSWKDKNFKPLCLHMAGTGDHFFWRRRKLMATPLLNEFGIGSVILENPFYGLRKPKYQLKSVLHNVSDIFVMGGCLILEALVLYYWCRKMGYGPLGVTGLSMGGHMASLAATNWPEPAVVVPCLSWSTASGVFTKGVMAHSINWKMLASQYSQNEMFSNVIKNMLSSEFEKTPKTFQSGHKVVNDFPKPISTLLKTTDDATNVKYEIKHDLTQFYEKFNSAISDFFKSKLSFFNDYMTLTEEDILNSGSAGFREFQDAVIFMRSIMDDCTHLKHFSVPVDTSLIISVFAQNDGYVPQEGCDLSSIWPGAEMRLLKTGHIAAFVFYMSVFRKAIADAFDKYKIKYL